MSFRLGILAAVDAARSLAGPSGLDIRTNRVTVRTRTWSGGRLKLGTATDSDLELSPHFPVRYLSSHEVSSSAGEYEVGDIFVNHITPSNGAGVGFTPAQLKPVVTANNVEIIYLITGEHAGEYGLVELRTYRPFTYQLVLRRRTVA